jgi:N-acetylmuramoyl-L-alanine amidase
VIQESINENRRLVIKCLIFGAGALLFGKIFAINANNHDDIDKLIAKHTINAVLAIRIWQSDVYTRLIVEAMFGIRATFFSLTDPMRFVVDVHNAQLSPRFHAPPIDFSHDAIINSIKIAQHDHQTLRIVIYLKQQVMAHTTVLQPVHLQHITFHYRYLFDMYPQHLSSSQPHAEDQLLNLLALTESKSLASLAESTASIHKPLAITKTLPKRKFIVMLDPGHGGEDPGAIGRYGTKEKNVVLHIAKILYTVINSSEDMCAKLTRYQDIFIALNTRVALARHAKADIMLSIHADAFPAAQARGSSVFMLSEHGASSVAAKWLAKSQNNSDLIGGVSVNDKRVQQFIMDMAQTYTQHNSALLGQSILACLSSINKLHSHRLENAAFAVLKAPDIPSVLIESAFLSNANEEKLLNTTTFLEAIAQQVFAGIKNYRQRLT